MSHQISIRASGNPKAVEEKVIQARDVIIKEFGKDFSNALENPRQDFDSPDGAIFITLRFREGAEDITVEQAKKQAEEIGNHLKESGINVAIGSARIRPRDGR